ncbi:MAG: hypothetical protein JO263_04190 [Candidatus Eremiobacteraeota bacterium]|nr:hypothetical protein [Candidatus Eremiobacteraeota bacterium]
MSTAALVGDNAKLSALARLLQALDAAGRDERKIEALLDVLMETPALNARGAGLLRGSSDGLSFVLTAARSSDATSIRRWKRWPLRRLFNHMKPSRVVSSDNVRDVALAIPLRHGHRKSVAIATLGLVPDDESESFFSIVESVTIPVVESAISPPESPSTEADPVIAAIGLCEPLQTRLLQVARSRGWSVLCVERINSLYGVAAALDLIVVDAKELADPARTLRKLHLVGSPEVGVSVFDSERRLGIDGRALTDFVLPHDASEIEIFSVLKDAVRQLPQRRRARFERWAAVAKDDTEQITAPDRLAQFFARRAAEAMGGWAGIALVSESGAAYRAEYPQFGGAILSSIPAAFLNDSPIFCSTVTTAFLEKVFDDVQPRQALMELAPVSGAAVPLIFGPHRLGILIAVSRERSVPLGIFEAIEELAQSVAGRFLRLIADTGFIPEFQRQECWERWLHDRLAIAVYRSADCTTPWRYRPLPESRGLLMIGVPHDEQLYDRFVEHPPAQRGEATAALLSAVEYPGGFAAVLDAPRRTIHYACHQFAQPLLLGNDGPGAIITATQERSTGIATLDESRGMVVCDQNLRQWLNNRHRSAESVCDLLEQDRPPGFASVLTMRSQYR